MNPWQKKVAVVTGASSGIGAAICKRFVKEGLQVVGLARRVERITELADSLKDEKGSLHALKCDVTIQEEVEQCFKWVKENVGTIQILVNNAGTVRSGTIIEGDPRDWKVVLDTNLLGLCICTREAYAQMKDVDLEAHIINISSISGHFNICGDPPAANIYGSTKAAINYLTEVLRKEIVHSKRNIKVTSISPGLVKTEIFFTGGVPAAEQVSTQFPILSGDEVADTLVYVISRPSNVHIQDIIIRPAGEKTFT